MESFVTKRNNKKLYELGSCLAQGRIPEYFEDHFIDVLFPVIKAKFALFQMEIEGMFTHTAVPLNLE